MERRGCTEWDGALETEGVSWVTAEHMKTVVGSGRVVNSSVFSILGFSVSLTRCSCGCRVASTGNHETRPDFVGRGNPCRRSVSWQLRSVSSVCSGFSARSSCEYFGRVASYVRPRLSIRTRGAQDFKGEKGSAVWASTMEFARLREAAHDLRFSRKQARRE